MKVIIIDNYDSFTYNLLHLVRQLGVQCEAVRNDRFELSGLAAYDRIILSPGPGIPSEAGLMPQVIEAYAGLKPMLGVCLGHQAIGEAFGARLENLSEVFHGVQTPIHTVAGEPLFAGLPQTLQVGRYHSWVVSREQFPACLAITATSDEGQIMALRHRELDIAGVQFHPESVLTPDGAAMLSNWLGL